MQITQFLETVKWITEQYSEKTKDLIFSNNLFNISRGVGIASEKNNLSQILSLAVKASNEMAVVKVKLDNHPFASQILKEFGLGALLNEDFFVSITEEILSGESQHNSGFNDSLYQLLIPVSRNWNLLTKIVSPLEKLLIPQEVSKEKDFDDILTIELKYDHNTNPQPSVICDVFNNIEQLYASIAISLGKKNYSPLQLIFIASGTSFRFDFKGLGEPIKQVKNLLVEAWTKYRHKEADNLNHNNQAVLGSLEVLRHIDANAKQNILEPEEAQRLKEHIIRSTVSLFEAGALPREIPNIETISNQNLIQGMQVKLLPASTEKEENGKTKRVSNTKPRSNTKRKPAKKKSDS